MSYYPEMGLSATAIAGHGTDHPHDPGDLRRCMDYCEARGITTEQLQQRMRHRSTAWGRLVAEWDHLVGLLRHEMETRTDGTAPRTYAEMRRVIADGITCTNCGGTGRGVECEKCKGTGRRSGGHCRATRCYQGADLCPTCWGEGFTRRA